VFHEARLILIKTRLSDASPVFGAKRRGREVGTIVEIAVGIILPSISEGANLCIIGGPYSSAIGTANQKMDCEGSNGQNGRSTFRQSSSTFISKVRPPMS
jgi:hypothetical protein